MQPKDLAQQMTEALDNLALTVVFKNEIIKSLALINGKHIKTIANLAKENGKLLQIIKNLTKEQKTNESNQNSNGDNHKNGYCQKHGCAMAGHTCKMCKSRVQEHNEEATSENTIGASK